MKSRIPQTDTELDVVWRAAFGEPLPILGAPDIAAAILADHLANRSTMAAKG